ncbi:hypothetical protein KY333_01030 [Candidatus Woesearchaeota archaeon]|nr:hypothetical protein [Candidatus Woesearchaeota archaeon]MBW2994437.1 hypothetical protein [Candidatus Woesearchaeota archaeon]
MKPTDIQPPVETIIQEPKNSLCLMIFTTMLFIYVIQIFGWVIATGIKLAIWQFKKDFEFPKVMHQIDSSITVLLDYLSYYLD